MTLILKADPTQLEAAAGRAETALAGVKKEAVATESAIDRLGREAARDLAPVADGARRVAGSAGEMARATEDVANRSRNMGFQVQNAAYQIGDMAVQVAGGVSPMRAMAQQLPQLLGGFGLIGAVLGGAVAVVAAVAPAFSGIATAADEAATATDTLGTSLADLEGSYNAAVSLNREYVAAVKTGNEQLIQAIELEAQARQAQFNLQRIESSEVAKAAAEAQAAIRGEYDATVARGLVLVNQLSDLREGYARQQEEVAKGNFGAGATDFLGQIETVQFALEENVAQMERQKAELDKTSAEYALINAQVEVLNAKIAANGDLINIVKNGLEDSADAAVVLTNSAPGDGWLASAIGQADTLADTLWDAARGAVAAARLVAERASYGSGPSFERGGRSGPSAGPIAPPPAPTLDDFIADAASRGGTGSGSSAIDDTRAAYDRLLASLDPVVAKTQDMAKATGVVNAALAAGEINATEHASAIDLIRQKYDEAGDAMAGLRDAGANAFDALLERGASLGDVMKQLARDIVMATAKAELLKHVTGGTSSMSIGGLLMQGLFAGFKDEGGAIPNGSFAVVGERGPELVRATPGGAMVTSRVDTARMLQPQSQNVHVTISVDDDGKIVAIARREAKAGATAAVDTVKRSLPAWNSMLAVDGALA